MGKEGEGANEGGEKLRLAATVTDLRVGKLGAAEGRRE